jgi:ribosome-associated protein
MEDFITLGQYLKLKDFISTGGEAKHFLGNNKVLVNGEIEARRGRKLKTGDVVVIAGKEYLVE